MHSRQPSVDSARRKLDQILARPEYAAGQKETWWDKLRARIDNIITDLLNRLFHGLGSQASLGYALLWIGVCAAAILIAYWRFTLWFRSARVEEMAPRPRGNPVAVMAGMAVCRARSLRARRLPRGDPLRVLGGRRATAGLRRTGARSNQDPARISSRPFPGPSRSCLNYLRRGRRRFHHLPQVLKKTGMATMPPPRRTSANR